MSTPFTEQPGAPQSDRFFEIAIDMMCLLGYNGYFKRLNPAWERTLGFARTELMSRPFIEFVHPDDQIATERQESDEPDLLEQERTDTAPLNANQTLSKDR